MKKILTYFIIGAVALGATSCKKYLDINDNPNSPTESTPQLVLPGAIVGTAGLVNTYNSNFVYPAGYFANIYGVGGYGATISLNYTSTNFTGVWSASYDNATDYQYVLDATEGDATLIYANAMARIMKAFVFGKLVDQYNDVPYSEALKGAALLTPKYDNAEDIYQDLVAQLNRAITDINTGLASTATTEILATQDPMFGGNMARWKVLANTIKLKLLVKMAGVPALSSFANTEFAAFDSNLGVIGDAGGIDDALVNPGYVKQSGKLSPLYGYLAANENDQRSQGQAIPTTWILSFYNGTKIADDYRGYSIFSAFPSSPTNQLGNENTLSTQVPPQNGTSWYTGDALGSTDPVPGVAKAPTQAQPVFMGSEAQFLKAEAIVKGYLSGDAQATFERGIRQSFHFTLLDQFGAEYYSVSEGLAEYYDVNSTNRLVNFELAATDAQKLEAIITQKYIAMNVINADEAFNEYRRTGYPTVTGTSATGTFASTQSTSTRADRMLSRIPYPQTEYTLNASNVPQNIRIFEDKIFWDVND
ncbi:SusD/RagB family nutrient-binding outer membrane lipoprotein [Mucilaginibacter sp. JRF]|uniref:SusD/RagB family nutrient-binding outer membrane lipoprotein n=1 Tax=Mucilaginibacter sp. JRF TaxID=2780088 RepID=UPI00187F7366|nr:SusD/RagB family nutrient-binding outer membrane lipoprotein [Mucilaginibacter sp. JRF]MBE9586489.1 SusD/RagB family nutrient-binding outer membrane lipoprotein [Mucilaginibacter sp. JRF]